MAHIQSATTEIRQGKKKKKQDENIMSESAAQGGHNKTKTQFGRNIIGVNTALCMYN